MSLKSLFKSTKQSGVASVGLLAVRLVAGLAFVHHGWGKIQHPLDWMGPDSGTPAFFQALAAISEFGGGMAWMVGALTPLASFGLVCTMAVAVWTHAVKMGDPFISPTGGRCWELAGVYLAIALLLLFAGPGKFSADRALLGEKE